MQFHMKNGPINYDFHCDHNLPKINLSTFAYVLRFISFVVLLYPWLRIAAMSCKSVFLYFEGDKNLGKFALELHYKPFSNELSEQGLLVFLFNEKLISK